MRDLSKVLKVKIPPVAILISGLIIVGLLTALGGILHYGNELSSNSETSIADASKGQDNEPAEKLGEKNKETSSNQTDPANGSTEFYSNNLSSPELRQAGGSSARGTNAQNTDSRISYIKASLNINGAYRGTMTLKSPAYQCDVLRQAQAKGLLTVDMSNKEFGQYVVYVIDGAGDKNHQRIEWTYKVNGSLAPLGCQYMPVKNGDSINWEYIK